ncbi:hypothetical protein [Glaciecola sp. KUL10]|uniref:hypothetical protein n=1 Tax=Glaciecola sp. (strain KUL10) TaxID=2161813 RepID=UPI000D78938C|nr:hypothetical protein [Glaciecola sp. KUL10]GBL03226.1 hypothetical protein KUL10_05080 [Glaciecola sp. KUL10]
MSTGMPFLEVVPNNKALTTDPKTVLCLKLDANTDVVLGDRPVFGAAVTIKDDLSSLVNTIISPDVVIGWVNYAQLSKLGCTSKAQYFDAQDYVVNNENQLSFKQPVKIISVKSKLDDSKEILEFVCL